MSSHTRFIYDFPRPSVTATVALFVLDDQNNLAGVVLGKRGNVATYAGYWCLPGGFLDAKVATSDIVELVDGAYVQPLADNSHQLRAGETVEDTAVREILEETGLNISQDSLVVSHVHSDPSTDPRAHVVNVCFYACITKEIADTAIAGDDLAELAQVPIDTALSNYSLAFNHSDLLRRMVDRARKDMRE